jgi:hypothetical protein
MRGLVGFGRGMENCSTGRLFKAYMDINLFIIVKKIER